MISTRAISEQQEFLKKLFWDMNRKWRRILPETACYRLLKLNKKIKKKS